MVCGVSFSAWLVVGGGELKYVIILTSWWDWGDGKRRMFCEWRKSGKLKETFGIPEDLRNCRGFIISSSFDSLSNPGPFD
jgi:hypothetical protein